jgi:cell division septal protein FtsQ
MGKHEIRMRRQRLTARGTERFKNYGAVLKQHEQEKKMKKIVRVFTFFLLIVVVVVLILWLNKWEKKGGKKVEDRSCLPTGKAGKVEVGEG